MLKEICGLAECSKTTDLFLPFPFQSQIKNLKSRITMSMTPYQIVALASLLLISTTSAEDWPQFRGPRRDGTSKETGLRKEWPAEGPKLLWKIADLGNGYSSLAVVEDRFYTLGNQGMESEFVEARGIKDAKRVWKTQQIGRAHV